MHGEEAREEQLIICDPQQAVPDWLRERMRRDLVEETNPAIDGGIPQHNQLTAREEEGQTVLKDIYK